MAINNQDKTEIHNLPEVTTLQPGMMVAVDSEPTGTKSFNLTTALEGKASADDMTDLATAVSGKAEASDLTSLATTVEGKADSSTTYTKTEVDQAISGIREVPSSSSSDEGKVLMVDANGTPGWDKVNAVPQSTSSDSSKFLMVNTSGVPEWNSLPPVGETLVVGVAVPLGEGAIVADKTYREIKSAIVAGYNVVIRTQQGSNPEFYDDWAEYYVLSRYDGDYDNYPIEFYRVESYGNSDNMPTITDPKFTMSDRSIFVSQIVVFNNDTWKFYRWNASPGIRDAGTQQVTQSPFEISNNMHNGITTSLSSLELAITTIGNDLPNVAVEITPSVNLTLTVTTHDWFGQNVRTLKHSVSAGNTLTAGKTYQVTAVGNCWTLAEFTA